MYATSFSQLLFDHFQDTMFKDFLLHSHSSIAPQDGHHYHQTYIIRRGDKHWIEDDVWRCVTADRFVDRVMNCFVYQMLGYRRAF